MLKMFKSLMCSELVKEVFCFSLDRFLQLIYLLLPELVASSSLY